MSYRDEAIEFGDALTDAIVKATDDTDNGEEVGVLLQKAFAFINETADFAKIPQSERLEAAMLGMAHALSETLKTKIVFSDEV